LLLSLKIDSDGRQVLKGKFMAQNSLCRVCWGGKIEERPGDEGE